jgi:transposase
VDRSRKDEAHRWIRERRHERQSRGERRNLLRLVKRSNRGKICKLKLFKREMYGRAKLDLLQATVIGAG